MSVSIETVVILIIIAAAAGYGFAILDRRVTQSVKEKIAEMPKPAEPAPVIPQAPDEHLALKVTVDKALAWHLELDGMRLEPNALTTDQRARLVNIIVQIRPWIDGRAASAPAATSAPAPVPALDPLPVQTAPVAATASAKPQPPQAASSEPPKVDFMRGVRTLLRNEVKSPDKMKPISIVEMIDEFLQARLADSSFAGQDIRLEEGAIGEVIVLIGKERYSGVDAVPDPQVQALIRSAISDWEKSS